MQNFVCIRAMTFDEAMMSSINSQSLHVSYYKNGEIYPSTTWSLHTQNCCKNAKIPYRAIYSRTWLFATRVLAIFDKCNIFFPHRLYAHRFPLCLSLYWQFTLFAMCKRFSARIALRKSAVST